MQRRAYLGDKFKYQWYLCYQAKKCELTLVDVEFLVGFMDFVSHESRNDTCSLQQTHTIPLACLHKSISEVCMVCIQLILAQQA